MTATRIFSVKKMRFRNVGRSIPYIIWMMLLLIGVLSCGQRYVYSAEDFVTITQDPYLLPEGQITGLKALTSITQTNDGHLLELTLQNMLPMYVLIEVEVVRDNGTREILVDIHNEEAATYQAIKTYVTGHIYPSAYTEEIKETIHLATQNMIGPNKSKIISYDTTGASFEPIPISDGDRIDITCYTRGGGTPYVPARGKLIATNLIDLLWGLKSGGAHIEDDIKIKLAAILLGFHEGPLDFEEISDDLFRELLSEGVEYIDDIANWLYQDGLFWIGDLPFGDIASFAEGIFDFINIAGALAGSIERLEAYATAAPLHRLVLRARSFENPIEISGMPDSVPIEDLIFNPISFGIKNTSSAELSGGYLDLGLHGPVRFFPKADCIEDFEDYRDFDQRPGNCPPFAGNPIQPNDVNVFPDVISYFIDGSGGIDLHAETTDGLPRSFPVMLESGELLECEARIDVGNYSEGPKLVDSGYRLRPDEYTLGVSFAFTLTEGSNQATYHFFKDFPVALIAADGTPAHVVGLDAWADGNTIHLTWLKNQDPAPEISSYHVWRRASATEWTEIAQISSEMNSYVDTGLNTGTDYEYSIIAENAEGQLSERVMTRSVSTPSVPVASIDAISPNPALQASISITLTGSGQDPNDPGNPDAITQFEWTLNPGFSDTQESDSFVTSESSFLIEGADVARLEPTSHIVSLKVWAGERSSSPVTSTLTVLSSPSESEFTLYSPTQGAPYALPPGGSYSVDAEWNLTDVAGHTAGDDYLVSIQHETNNGNWYNSKEAGPFSQTQQRRTFSNLWTSSYSELESRDLRIRILDGDTRATLIEKIEPDALNFTNQPSQDFAINFDPTSRNVDPGEWEEFTVSIEGLNGFNSLVTLDIAGSLPAGVEATLSDSTLYPGESTSLGMQTSANSPPGTYAITVEGNGGGVVTTAQAPLTITGESLQVTMTDFEQVDWTPELRIDLSLEGTGSYYHFGYEYAFSSSGPWYPIDPSAISGSNPVSPGSFSLFWDTAETGGDLIGNDGRVYFRMTFSSNETGEMESDPPINLPIDQVWGATWTGSQFILSAYHESVARMYRFTSSWSSTGSPIDLPVGTFNWSLAWNGHESQLYAIDGVSNNRIYRLNSDYSVDEFYESPAVQGSVWADVAPGSPFLFLVDNMTLRKGYLDFVSGKNRFVYDNWDTPPGEWTMPIDDMTGITFDGTYLYICSNKLENLEVLRLRASQPGGTPRSFPTEPIGSDRFRDIVYNSSNGTLWGVARDYVKRITIPEVFDLPRSSTNLDVNAPPEPPTISLSTSPEGGDIQIDYILGDAENDMLSIVMQYSIDGGSSWENATISGSVEDIGSGDYTGSWIWHSSDDLPDFSGEVLVRLRSYDNEPGEWSNQLSLQITNEIPLPAYAPDTPSNIYPFEGQTDLPTTPTLIASVFEDANPESTFSRARFQVRADVGDFASPLLDTELDPASNHLSVPDETLQKGTKYWWRARYRDDTELWSAWSVETSFTTESDVPPPGAFDLVAPADNEVFPPGEYPPKLDWAISEGADEYDVFFSKTTTSPSMAGATSQTEFPVAGPLDAGTYSWRIEAVNDGGTVSSPTRQFVVEALGVGDIARLDGAPGVWMDGSAGDHRYGLHIGSSNLTGGDPLTWRVPEDALLQALPEGVSREDFLAQIGDALALWADVAPGLTFEMETDAEAPVDIEIVCLPLHDKGSVFGWAYDDSIPATMDAAWANGLVQKPGKVFYSCDAGVGFVSLCEPLAGLAHSGTELMNLEPSDARATLVVNSSVALGGDLLAHAIGHLLGLGDSSDTTSKMHVGAPAAGEALPDADATAVGLLYPGSPAGVSVSGPDLTSASVGPRDTPYSMDWVVYNDTAGSLSDVWVIVDVFHDGVKVESTTLPVVDPDTGVFGDIVFDTQGQTIPAGEAAAFRSDVLFDTSSTGHAFIPNDPDYEWRCQVFSGGYPGSAGSAPVSGIKVVPLELTDPLPERPVNDGPADGATDVDGPINLAWQSGQATESYEIYLGKGPVLGPDDLASNQGGIGLAVDAWEEDTSYFWRVDATGPNGTVIGKVWSFRTSVPPATLPGPVTAFSPSGESTGEVPINSMLQWSPSKGASSYDVYLSDPGPVTSGDAGGVSAAPGPLSLQGNVTEPQFEPGLLELNSAYNWRVDARNEQGIATGEVQTFTTENKLVVLHPVASDQVVPGQPFQFEWIGKGASPSNVSWKFFLNRNGVFYTQLFPQITYQGDDYWTAVWNVPSNMEPRNDYNIAFKDDVTLLGRQSDVFSIGLDPVLPAELANISTRGQVLTGDSVMIGGFIIEGQKAKDVVIRGRGHSLEAFDVPGVLHDPILQIYSDQTVIAENDDWFSDQQEEIEATGLAPPHPSESAVRITLPPGPYTAILRGVPYEQDNGTGVGIVEVFDVDEGSEVELMNISTRGEVGTADDVMIGGFIIRGDEPQQVIVRARGPSLEAFGVTGTLSDPTLEIFEGSTSIGLNDDWQDTQSSEIESSGFAPAENSESAILLTLDPGGYTAIVRGAGGRTGVAIVEVFRLTP